MRSFGIVALSVMLGGCASVTRGTTENISISSTPSGVEAVVSGTGSSDHLHDALRRGRQAERRHLDHLPEGRL